METWLRKVKLVTKLKNITSLHDCLPLYLEVATFAIYKGREDGTKIEEALLSAFTQDNIGTYDTFRQRSWGPDESVDVRLADLWLLARLAKAAYVEWVQCSICCSFAGGPLVFRLD